MVTESTTPWIRIFSDPSDSSGREVPQRPFRHVLSPPSRSYLRLVAVKVYIKPRSRILFNGSLEKQENSESEKGLRSLSAKCSWNTVSERESRFRKWSRSFEPASWIKCCHDNIKCYVRGKLGNQAILCCCYYFLDFHRVSLKSILQVNTALFHRTGNGLNQIVINKLFWSLYLKQFKISKVHKNRKLVLLFENRVKDITYITTAIRNRKVCRPLH